MKLGSLFSGVGGLELGLEWAGLGHTIWQVEREPFCLAVLAKRWPTAERFTDVRAVGKANLAAVDLICGGFPCQDVSSAGKGAGLAGDRSVLWSEFARILGELKPRWVVVENVAGGARKWVDAIVLELERLGYACLPIPVSASDVGAPHRRSRIFVVAHLDGVRELQPQGSEPEQRGRVADGSASDSEREHVREQQGRSRSASYTWRPLEPGVVPLVYGLPGGLAGRGRRARIRALGNSVVPQQAEVVGHVIRILIEAGKVRAA